MYLIFAQSPKSANSAQFEQIGALKRQAVRACTQRRVLLPLLAATLQIAFASTQVLAQQGETIHTETTTTGEPQVTKSFMVPTLMQTKETTDASGDTTKSSAPMIMERHEQVVVPQEKTVSDTTIEKTPQVVEEQIEHKSTSVKRAAPRAYKCATNKPKRHIAQVSHKTAHKPRHQIAEATDQVTIKRTVVEQPTVVQHTEKTLSNPITFERKDPALGN